MRKTQHILYISLYTFLLTVLIFIGKEIFFPNTLQEEKYIEPTLWAGFSQIQDISIGIKIPPEESTDISQDSSKPLLYEAFKEKYSRDQKNKVFLRYIPSVLEEKIEYSYLPLVEVFLYKKDILSHIQKLGVFFYTNRWDTRWRMKGWNIHLYGVEKFTDSEFLSVLIHEFGHYYDIYSLPGNAFWDLSQRFYDISWDSTTRIKKWALREDFVSWYSMTNQYEDFAESYLYYILHNDDFLEKAQESRDLQKKYAYIRDYIFTKNQFTGEDFSSKAPEKYHWDITKIRVDVKKFLQYLQEAI